MDASKLKSFHEYLSESMESHQSFLTANGYKLDNLETIYIGGGTPSLWGSEGILFLRELLTKYEINLSKDLEFTCELNPGSWKSQSVQQMIDLGVNRFSIGVQAFDEKLLKALDRIHSLNDVEHTLGVMSGLGVNFSIDLMLGLPKIKNHLRDLEGEVKRLMKYNPGHISSYILTVNKSYIHNKDIPDEDNIADEYLMFSDLLKNYNFDHYEVSNFSKIGNRSRHNLAYWKSDSVAALGPSATGYLNGGISSQRYKWKTSGASFTTEKIDSAQMALEELYLRLRTNLGTNLLKFLKPSANKKKLFDLLKSWEDSGLLHNGDIGNLALSSKGYLSSDMLLGQLFQFVK